MGALAEFLPGYVPVDNAEKRRAVAKLWEQPDLPTNGLTVTEMVDAILDGKIKALVIMGENPIVSDPSSADTEKALSRLELLAVQDIFPTETAQFAHVVLPAALWVEKSGSYTNTERRVQWSPKVFDPPGEAKPDLWITGSLGKRLEIWRDIPSPENVLREINQVVPSYRGITPERILTSPEGLIWPCSTTDHGGTPILHSERFATEDGLGKFLITDLDFKSREETREELFSLITGRVVVHYNSGSMTRRIESLSRYEPEPRVTIHPNDAERLGLRDGDVVTVETKDGAVQVVVRVGSEVRSGSVFMPFHFSETNRLTPKELDPLARIPSFKDARCRIVKRESEYEGGSVGNFS
jgi:formate dehydrogenase major subunit